VQANNIYLEVLADLGVLGLAAFAWVIGEPLVAAARGGHSGSYVAVGVGVAIVAFLVHGLLDSFLAFNPTAWLLWLLLGIAWTCRRMTYPSPLEAQKTGEGAQKPQVSGRW
jgi:hypothetical protein